MAEKVKKRPSFFLSFKRFSSHREDTGVPATPVSQAAPPMYRSTSQMGSRQINSTTPDNSKFSRKFSGGIKDLIQCALCLEILTKPKMLPCQHTFCCACLKIYVADLPIINCPICRTRIQVHSTDFVEELPSNLYIDTLLAMVGVNEDKKKPDTPPSPMNNMQSVELFAAGVRCSHCRSICDDLDISNCEHCKSNFCKVCWLQHLADMRTQIGSILKELDSAASRLEHKIEHYEDRFDRIIEQINSTAEEKINAILQGKMELLREASELQKLGDMTALGLKSSLGEARDVAKRAMNMRENVDDEEQVMTFINLHTNTLQLLTEVSKWDSEKYAFDKENFRIESDSTTPYDAESDDPLPEAAKQDDPMESEASLSLHYRSRNFIPHYIWRKTSRPSGVGISPWNNHLYICGMDSHSVLVVERAQAKIVTRLSCDEMLCPVHIAFMKSLGEIYVTDKWKHCVHVFSKDGDYLRSLGQKGSRAGMFRSPEGIATDNAQHHIYVVDTGNDRVQVIETDGKFVDQYGVATKQQAMHTSSVWETKEMLCTEFNGPTAVAITNDRVIVLDSGNRRVKVYNKQDKSKIVEFGSLGQRKGQFRQPECLAVDPMGFILVGDSGNCRVQVFRPNGQLVRVFGRLGSEPGKFGWISGIYVTKQLDIIVSDTKNHSVNFF
ncbi:RING finger protein nhl-1-like [Maniola jurtina]|uniref:RING finger protein nhl-1-like n=1 Tax=Maniola jurtina TaxID=191418 RepID=UPI001E687A65|nr:RING finger protein nhl-1-like [Maniola jurtina]